MIPTTEQIWIQKMYLGFYSRAADLGGMNYWVDKLKTGGFPAMVEAFMISSESKKLYTQDKLDAAFAITLKDSPPAPPLPIPSTGKLVWLTDKAAALNLARVQGKKVLLLGGRESCITTTGMRDIACESPRINETTNLPEPLDPPIKALIEQRFIPWYGNSDQNTEYYSYKPAGVQYSLPTICVIDPSNPAVVVANIDGAQKFTTLYDWLLKYSG